MFWLYTIQTHINAHIVDYGAKSWTQTLASLCFQDLEKCLFWYFSYEKWLYQGTLFEK